MRVLLIEDEPHLGSAVQDHVRAAGHAVDWFERLEPAEDAVRTVSYDALLLDLHLPDGRGLDFLRKLRRRGDALPVVILTARDLVSDRIEGLKAGADDYIVKPFDLDEVNARLDAVSRRYFGKSVPVLQVGPVELEWEAKVARMEGRPVELSAREWAVIEVLDGGRSRRYRRSRSRMRCTPSARKSRATPSRFMSAASAASLGGTSFAQFAVSATAWETRTWREGVWSHG